MELGQNPFQIPPYFAFVLREAFIVCVLNFVLIHLQNALISMTDFSFDSLYVINLIGLLSSDFSAKVALNSRGTILLLYGFFINVIFNFFLLPVIKYQMEKLGDFVMDPNTLYFRQYWLKD